jgi:hypothetical protein
MDFPRQARPVVSGCFHDPDQSFFLRHKKTIRTALIVLSAFG